MASENAQTRISPPTRRAVSSYPGRPSFMGSILAFPSAACADGVIPLKLSWPSADDPGMTFLAARRLKAQYKRRDLEYAAPRRFDAVRVFAPIVTVFLSIGVGALLGRLI